MPEYLKDPDYTAERIAELATTVEMATYELGAAVALARVLGLTWGAVGDALGITAQGAQQRFTRTTNRFDVLSLEPDERERIARLIGVGERVTRFEVVRLEGRRGVTKVTIHTVSRHLRPDTAIHRAEKVAADRGESIEVHRVEPDGKRRVLRVVTP